MQTCVIRTVPKEKPIAAWVPQFDIPSPPLMLAHSVFCVEKISSGGEVVEYAVHMQLSTDSEI